MCLAPARGNDVNLDTIHLSLFLLVLILSLASSSFHSIRLDLPSLSTYSFFPLSSLIMLGRNFPIGSVAPHNKRSHWGYDAAAPMVAGTPFARHRAPWHKKYNAVAAPMAPAVPIAAPIGAVAAPVAGHLPLSGGGYYAGGAPAYTMGAGCGTAAGGCGSLAGGGWGGLYGGSSFSGYCGDGGLALAGPPPLGHC
eukprot:TRINITY_DN1285_c0_g2_i1.p1 TRINITY_DN1285_c0_g2~~TRINITY_DN1285_c0_g2_i1.p1  ORF type:complete len:195 (-),score=19.62 TRINITY_DN1285_c0_g2_i1:67-651(-)